MAWQQRQYAGQGRLYKKPYAAATRREDLRRRLIEIVIRSKRGRRIQMGFCANCGAAVAQGSGFCGACGKPVTAANPGSPAPVAVSSAGAGSGNTGLSSNVAGALAYILGLITGILFLVLEPYKSDRFVRFHAMQSVLFSVACIVFAIVWGI